VFTQQVITGVVSIIALVLGLLITFNVVISKQHQRRQRSLAEELAFARVLASEPNAAAAQQAEESSSDSEPNA